MPTKRAFCCNRDLWVTLLLWCYFTVGFVLLFSPFYLAAVLFSASRESAFQKLNHQFYNGFFRLMHRLIPGFALAIPDEVRRLRSVVIVCNHQSYLDPLLLVSLFPRHKTIVKHRFFSVPVFGWFLKQSGYIPSRTDGPLAMHALRCVEKMGDFLAGGGNLFVFPEGTRATGGPVAPLRKGAFSIARRCRADIAVLYLENTSALFTPGRFLFNTEHRVSLNIRLVDILHPDYDAPNFKLRDVIESITSMFAREGRKS